MPTWKPSPEREQEIIDQVSRFIVNNGLTTMADLFLTSLRPGATVLMPFGSAYLFPFSPLLGSLGPEFSYMLINKPEQTVDRLQSAIAKFDEERKLNEKKDNRSFLDKIFRRKKIPDSS